MYDITTTANNVETWTALGVDLPKDLTTALTTLDAVRWVEAPAPMVDPSKITAKNADTVVQAVTDDLVRQEKHAQAKRLVTDRVAREVLRTAGAAVPSVIDQLTPRFDAAVATFKAAVDKLPEELTADGLVKAGPDALKAYGDAKEAAGVIARIDSWLAGLVQLPAYGGRRPHAALRVFAPEDPAQLRVLVDAASATKVDALVRDLDPVLLAGVRAGITTELHTPIEADQLQQEIQAQADRARAEAPGGVAVMRRGR
ncbi:hypothetical protein [Rhodococcus ruber]